eukprot:7377829-Prymnesium_polylepis.1
MTLEGAVHRCRQHPSLSRPCCPLAPLPLTCITMRLCPLRGARSTHPQIAAESAGDPAGRSRPPL